MTGSLKDSCADLGCLGEEKDYCPQGRGVRNQSDQSVGGLTQEGYDEYKERVQETYGDSCVHPDDLADALKTPYKPA